MEPEIKRKRSVGRGNINSDHKSSHVTKVSCSMWEVMGELAKSSLARGL